MLNVAQEPAGDRYIDALYDGDVACVTRTATAKGAQWARPACLSKQGGDLAIAIAAVLAGKLNDVGCQPFSIFSAPRDLALRRAVLPERRAGATLGDVQVLTNMLDAGAPPRGA